jgi:putative transposase
MPYCHLYYHVVWSTKNRHPFLTAKVEPTIYSYLRSKAIGLGGTVFTIGGIEDHVHMVVSIPAKIAVADFVGKVKGVASTRLNKEHPGEIPFAWQAEYGAFTFDGKRLANIIAYVERQKEHHAQNNLIPVLERIEGEASRPIIRETAATYMIADPVWWPEMLAMDA